MMRDYVQRRIVIEYGLKYAYVYITDSDGKLLDEEAFTQPYRLDRKECYEEAKDTYDKVWDHMNETINFPSTGGGGASGRPEDEE